MRISRISIKDVLGIEELEFEPGAFTEISGANGQGKTSVIRALRSLLGDVKEGSLLRQGADKGEVVVILDDGSRLRRSWTAAGGGTLSYDKDGVRQDAPSSAIKALTDALSVNPVEFLRAPAKKRVDVMLESLPIKADIARLEKIAGFDVKGRVNADMHALEAVDRVHKAIYDDRTATNGAKKAKEGTISQLASTLPQAGEGPEGDPAELEAEIARAEAERDTKLGKIETQLTTYRAGFDTKTDALQAELEAAQAVVAEIQGRIAEHRQWWPQTTRGAEQARDKARTACQEATAAARATLAAIRANAAAATRAEQTRATMRQMRSEADTLEEDSKRQTSALDALTAYKAELLAVLPVPGLAVVDGEITKDGIPFDTLNTAAQVAIAFEIAKLRAKDLGVICVDGLELLDSEHFEALRENALDSDVQLIVTRVTNGDLAIDAIDN